MKPFVFTAITLAALSAPALAHTPSEATSDATMQGHSLTVTVIERAPSTADKIFAQIAAESAEDE